VLYVCSVIASITKLSVATVCCDLMAERHLLVCWIMMSYSILQCDMVFIVDK